MLQGDSTASTSTSEVHHHASSAVDEGEEDVTLSTLLTRSIVAAEDLLDRAHELSSSKAAQGRLDSTLANLSLCSSLISHLNLLSANETLDELATSTIRCFLVPYYAGLLELQRRTRDYKSRAEALAVSQTNLESFVKQCDDYGVLSQDRRRTLHLTSASSSSADPSRRREAKIAQYKEERALKSRIEEMTKQLQSKSGSSIAAGSTNADPSSFEDEYLRPLLLAQISHAYLKAHNELSSISQELELLSYAPNMSELPSSRDERHSTDARERQKSEQDEAWRLDVLPKTGVTSARQLVDKNGRVLRPFTIMPSAASGGSSSLDTRLRLQSQVFQSSHRLPTMSIDEYLQMEQERGNILQGGGARNAEESKQEAADKRAWEEEEDNMAGDERAEAARRKAQEWDAYTDDHKRGEGNRMNRG